MNHDDDELDDEDFDGLALPAIREHIAEQLENRERPPAPRDAQEMRFELERLWHMPITDIARAPRRRTALPPTNAGPRGERGGEDAPCEWTGELFGDDRVRCLVPFCRRTIERVALSPHSEWVCGSHWRNVPAVTRAAYAKWKRRARRALGRASYPQMIERVHRAWERCKAQACEKAGGI